MKIYLSFILVFCTFFGFVYVKKTHALIITTECISESGKSTYNITIDTKKKNGDLRLRFFGQDLFYNLLLTEVDGTLVKGVAVFKKSNTGETKDEPFEFTYDFSSNKFSEFNLKADCE